jgi:ATP/maltotriose-dependent transcriptional regulator MalT/DNA-binding SARP family transcriptional activator
MSVPVTRTKIILPRRRPDLLTRQRLIDLLFDLMDYKLVIVAAPAGYGKTSLLIDFAHQSELTVCWLSLDALDQDPLRLIAYLIAAINQNFPEFGKQSQAALDGSNPDRLDLDFLISTIVNDAYEHIREHFLLILDDYHLVNDQKEISFFVNRLAQEIDENCHLILSSRSLLTLSDMPLMVARSMVGGLSFEELSFKPDEIQQLILQNYHEQLPASTAEELALATEGWITGLLLSTQLMPQGIAERVRVARVSRVGLYDYLAQQVLDQQPAEVRSFLLRTSLLEEFDLQLCTKILGPDPSWPHLFNHVLQSNLFILPVGEDGRYIRYHHLFRDFLQARLQQADEQEWRRIQHDLAAYFTHRHEWEKAYSILQRIEDVNGQSELILEAGPWLIKSSRLNILAEWLDGLPREIMAQQPALLSLRAVPAMVLGPVDQSVAWLREARAAQRAAGDTHGLAQTLSRLAVAERTLGDYQSSLAAAREALAISEQEVKLRPVYADSLRALGGSLYQLGELQEAIKNLNLALKAYEALDDHPNSATVLMELGLALQAGGHYMQALSFYEQALSYWREANNLLRQSNLLNNLGVLHHLIGNYEQAISAFDRALSLARLTKYERMQAYVHTSIGDLYTDLDATPAAMEAYRIGRELAQKISSHFLLFYIELARAASSRSANNLDSAERYLNSAQGFIVDASSSYEVGMLHYETGLLRLAQKDTGQAVDNLASAVRLFASTGQQVELARACLHLANALYFANEPGESLQRLEQAFNAAATVESPHVLVVAGRNSTAVLQFAVKNSQFRQAASELLQRIAIFENNIPATRKRLRPRAASFPISPPKLTIQAFGKGQVEIDSKPVTVPEWQNQRKARELFFYLLSKPEGATKEQIGAVFWPESSISQLKLQFKNAIYRLRHALGPDAILFDDNSYWFNQDLDYEYDVEDFTQYISRALAEPVEKYALYKSALQLYQGPYLPEAEGNWVNSERERLRQMYLQALLTLAQLLFESDHDDDALEYCNKALEQDPCLEEAHRLAMQIYARRGNRAGVNRQYERCRSALMREVNTPPSPKTISLYEALIR